MSEHGHGHAGASAGQRRLAVALGIAVVILASEIVGAAIAGSLALLTDAGHMVVDVGGLVVALAAARLATRPATTRRTWGLARVEVLAATAQAAVLIAVSLFVLVGGIARLLRPEPVESGPLLVFGFVALVGNVAAVAVLAGSRSETFNLRAAFTEVLSDALGALGVIVAAIVIATTGWLRADAVVALLIAALMLPRAFRLLRETLEVLLESAPRQLDLDAVRKHLLEVPHVREVHDLHASLISSNLPVLSAHVVVEAECFRDGHAADVLDELQQCVAEHFTISVEHSTFQLEPPVHAEHASDVHH